MYDGIVIDLIRVVHRGENLKIIITDIQVLITSTPLCDNGESFCAVGVTAYLFVK